MLADYLGVTLGTVNRLIQQPLEVSSTSLPELFAGMEWDAGSEQWEEEADLRKAIRYARGSKLLKIPPEWRAVIPTSI